MTTVKTSLEVQIPIVPNFLSLIGVEAPRSIAEFSEEELRNVAAQWTEKLVARSQTIKDQRKISKRKL